MSSIDWGDFPTWVTACATLAAAVGAFLAAGIAFNQLQDQRTELRGQAERQVRSSRRAYAENVAAWTGPHVEDCDHLRERRSKGHSVPYHFHSVVVRNGGTQPVFNVVVVIPMVPDPLRGKVNLALGLLPPGQTVEHTISEEPEYDPLFPEPLDAAFHDVQGLYWMRNADGTLVEVEPDSLPDGRG